MAFPLFALFKVGKKVAEHTGFVEAPDRNRPKKSAWIVLQILRFFTIIVLASVAVAEWSMIIKDGVPEAFFVFHAITHIAVSFFACFLIISEMGILKNYFFDNWPLFSDSHGLVWLGLTMILLGFKLLGNLTEEANSQDNLTMPLWRTVLAAGILNIIFGVFNVLCSFVYKTPMYTAREVRTFGSKLDGKNNAKEYDYETSTHRSESVREKPQPKWKRITRTFARGGKPNISHPMPVDESSQYSSDIEANYGYDDNRHHPEPRGSPIAPGVVRPPTALHPMNRYSEVSDMTRF